MPSEPTAVGIFDFDNHYYEAEDAFTRHADRSLRNRGVRWADIDGRRRLLVGGTLNSYIANPVFDPVAKPGALFDWYRGNPQRQGIVEAFGELEPIRPEYRDRDVRLKVMGDQGLDGTLLFPTLGVGIEDALEHDPEACAKVFEAFNRWLEDDWGYRYEGRIFAVPYIALVEPVAAAAELRRVIEAGAVAVNVRAAPVAVPGGRQSPFDPAFDEIWGLAAEAGIAVATHAGIDAYDPLVRMWEPGGAESSLFRSPLRGIVTKGRGVSDFYAAALCHKVFDRFPGPALRERRERGLVGSRHAPSARRCGQSEPRILRRASPRAVRRARLDHAVLGGRRGRPARRRARRSAPARIGLAPCRRHTGTSRFRVRIVGRPPRCHGAADRSAERARRTPDHAALNQRGWIQDFLRLDFAGARLFLGATVSVGSPIAFAHSLVTWSVAWSNG